MFSPTDQSHFLKYVTTLGVAIVVATLGVGGVLLQTQSDLMIDRAKIATLTPTAQDALQQKQQDIALLLKIAPWVSAGLIAGGLILCTYGLLKWKNRQIALDEKDALEIAKLKTEITQMTSPQIEAKIDAEVAELTEAIHPGLTEVDTTQGDSRQTVKNEPAPRANATSTANQPPPITLDAQATVSPERKTSSAFKDRVLETHEIFKGKVQKAWPGRSSGGPFSVRTDVAVSISGKEGHYWGVDAMVSNFHDGYTYVLEFRSLSQTPPLSMVSSIAVSLVSAAVAVKAGLPPKTRVLPVCVIMTPDVERTTKRVQNYLKNNAPGLALQPKFVVYDSAIFLGLQPRQLRQDVGAGFEDSL